MSRLVRAHLERVPFEDLSKLCYLRTRSLRGIPDLELYLDGIERDHFGGKGIDLKVGEIEVDMGPPDDYARIEAAVGAGEIRVPALGLSKEGLIPFDRLARQGTPHPDRGPAGASASIGVAIDS